MARHTRYTRSDIASFRTVYKDTGTSALELLSALKQFALYLGLIPVHLLLWLWLPELDEESRAAREKSRREWMDADF